MIKKIINCSNKYFLYNLRVLLKTENKFSL